MWWRWAGLTGQSEGRQVDGDVVLLAGQFTGVALQVVSVAGVLRHPLHLVATVQLGDHLGSAALRRHEGRKNVKGRRRS